MSKHSIKQAQDLNISIYINIFYKKYNRSCNNFHISYCSRSQKSFNHNDKLITFIKVPTNHKQDDPR
ncbi:hypothetical protein HanRHA438_Chr02g0080311 [Helianthus annuus]|nr:hypothetical protein HanRHA438_Chr02g0080311 [Helianthus annuus]